MSLRLMGMIETMESLFFDTQLRGICNSWSNCLNVVLGLNRTYSLNWAHESALSQVFNPTKIPPTMTSQHFRSKPFKILSTFLNT
ncbi:jg8789 [Pararge aegeria aegeria]|uniref:Jg8789 protein n=1 Tax=Pararge aegeria aegeria TaxID=348720 RepID=A0A8S4S0P2_9NEOP|nr:jg8789 [Pararge aegeria aegeria]